MVVNVEQLIWPGIEFTAVWSKKPWLGLHVRGHVTIIPIRGTACRVKGQRGNWWSGQHRVLSKQHNREAKDEIMWFRWKLKARLHRKKYETFLINTCKYLYSQLHSGWRILTRLLAFILWNFKTIDISLATSFQNVIFLLFVFQFPVFNRPASE